MTPVRFGAEAREMLGFYHAPARVVASAPAVLLCSPFGPEAIRSYRMLRLLADRLAAAGCPVLRFDYHGTGDSPGEDDVASLPGWAGDIGVAHRELAARSGKNTVAWIGLRLGASLCAMAAQTVRAGLGLLVLWDPVITGMTYLETYRSQSGPHAGVAFETMGFEFSDRFRNDLSTLNLANVVMPAGTRVTTIVGSENEPALALKSSLAKAEVKLDWTVSPAVAEWNSEKALNSAVIPMQLLQGIESKVMGHA
ncbi:MAG TPA: alpha/beta hydrolase [Steroidobacteraceae bacterium]|nr:alpha/beta hydrolase [Steroidobacteraceae bacterium]